LGKLKQICNRCPRTGESSKLVWLRDSLENITAEGDKALVFSQYVDEKFAGADWIESELADFGALNYSKATSDKKRREMLAAFQTNPEHKVFVGHPKTAGLGLNELVAANYVIHFDHWWNPAVMNQATARAHRPGQKKATVFAYDLWIEDTYEEDIFQILKEKQGLYDEVIDSASVQSEQAGSLMFVMADRLFEKYGLKSARRQVAGKPDTKNMNADRRDNPALERQTKKSQPRGEKPEDAPATITEQIIDQQSKPKIELGEVSGQPVAEQETFDLWRIKCHLEAAEIPTNAEMAKASVLVKSRKSDKSEPPTPRELADALKEIFPRFGRK
jgi:hypothetical protein